jgi:hypothetical protein
MRWRRLALPALLTPCLWAQGPARDLYIATPSPVIVAGDTAQLSAATRDAQGVLRPNDTFTWTTNAPGVLTVNARGVVTATGIGTATITAATPANTRGTIRLEVVPLRIRMTPSTGRMVVGETLPFLAEALDVNGNPIPNVNFTWQLTGANGGQINAGSLSRDGKLTASGQGLFTVRAILNIGGLPSGPFVNQFVGLANIEARRKPEFRLTRLLTTERVRPTAQLRRLRWMAANGAGQVAAIGSLDGLSEGVLLWENGRWDVLYTTGVPGTQAGSSVTSLDYLSMNSKGEVLFRTGERGGAGAIMLASRSGARIVFLSGQSTSGIENINNIVLSRRSLNESGDFVFRANYRPAGTNVNRQGLFKMTASGGLQPVWLGADPLQGMGANYSFRDNFGLDEDGNIFFLADDNRKRAIFRSDGLGRPTPMLAGGDKLDNLTIQDIDGLVVSPSGDVYFRAFIAQQRVRLARIVRNAAAAESIVPQYLAQLFSAGPDGVLFFGDTGRGAGLYRWRGGEAAAVALQSRMAPNGEPLSFISDGVAGAEGAVIVWGGTPNTSMLAFSAGNQPAVLFRFGARINGFSNISADGFVRGGLAGAPELRFGNGSGIFQLDGQTIQPRFVVGDRLPGGGTFSQYQVANRTPSGDLYVPSNDGLYRMAGSKLTKVLSYPGQTVERLPVYSTWNFAVNDAGAIVSDNWAGDHARLNLTANGRLATLATSGQNPRYVTTLPSGGTVNGWRELAIDEGGRVMAFLNVTGGPQGYFLYDAGAWKPAALITSTDFPGQVVTGLDSLRARGNKFYARIFFRSGSHLVAEYATDGWKTLVTRFDDVNGLTLQSADTFDVNRRGDLALIANFGSYRGIVLYADGAARFAHLGNETAPGGETLAQFWEIELREDRRIYFFGIDSEDYEYVYLAEPLF